MEDLSQDKINEKIEKAKELIRSHSIKNTRIIHGYKTDQEVAEYRNIKQKNRKKNKLEKNSRKNNRRK